MRMPRIRFKLTFKDDCIGPGDKKEIIIKDYYFKDEPLEIFRPGSILGYISRTVEKVELIE